MSSISSSSPTPPSNPSDSPRLLPYAFPLSTAPPTLEVRYAGTPKSSFYILLPLNIRIYLPSDAVTAVFSSSPAGRTELFCRLIAATSSAFSSCDPENKSSQPISSCLSTKSKSRLFYTFLGRLCSCLFIIWRRFLLRFM